MPKAAAKRSKGRRTLPKAVPRTWPRAIAKAMRKSIDAIREHRPAIDATDDVEAVHEIRIASRRLRNALWLFKAIIGGPAYRRWSGSLKALAGAMGLARDLDVHLEFLRSMQQRSRRVAQRRLLEAIILALASRRAALKNELAAAAEAFDEEGTVRELEREFAKISASQAGLDALAKLGGKKTLRRLEEMLAYEKHVKHPKRSAELHELRIAAKHLRYTLEILRPLHDRSTEACLDKVVGVHKLLGELHDHDVRLEDFPRLIAAAGLDGASQPPLDAFVASTARLRDATYRRFRRHWDACRRQRTFETIAAWAEQLRND